MLHTPHVTNQVVRNQVINFPIPVVAILKIPIVVNADMDSGNTIIRVMPIVGQYQ